MHAFHCAVCNNIHHIFAVAKPISYSDPPCKIKRVWVSLEPRLKCGTSINVEQFVLLSQHPMVMGGLNWLRKNEIHDIAGTKDRLQSRRGHIIGKHQFVTASLLCACTFYATFSNIVPY